jgi:hypothetical protein
MMTLPLLLLLAAPPNPNMDPKAPPPKPAQLVLKLGEQTLPPAKHATRCRCVDKEIVEGVLVDHRIELKATKKGATRCSLQTPGQEPILIDVIVE